MKYIHYCAINDEGEEFESTSDYGELSDGYHFIKINGVLGIYDNNLNLYKDASGSTYTYNTVEDFCEDMDHGLIPLEEKQFPTFTFDFWI